MANNEENPVSIPRDTGNLDTICRYCDASVLASTTTPEGVTPEEWHGQARCVEGNEPSRKMGGPA